MCQSCGKIIPAGTKFCPHCGAPVNTVPAGQFNPSFGTQAKNTENTKPEIKSEPKVNKNVCPNCGAKRSASEKFCGKCGAKFE
jgi:predicted amidophosphoribosyltransferase